MAVALPSASSWEQRAVSAPTDAELLARALGGRRPAAAIRMAAHHLAAVPPWERRRLGIEALGRRHGLNGDGVARLQAVWELSDRWAPDDRPSVASPRDALVLLQGIRDARREHVCVVLLDARHRALGVETVAVGTINSSRVSPRDVFAAAMRADAVAVILSHNHPSGDPSPSRADRVVTAAIRSAGEMLGVPLVDHVIVSRTGHHSFRESDGWDA